MDARGAPACAAVPSSPVVRRPCSEHRLAHIPPLRWETGTVLPAHVKEMLSGSEVQFFHEYGKIADTYMKAVGLDLTEVRGCGLVRERSRALPSAARGCRPH